MQFPQSVLPKHAPVTDCTLATNNKLVIRGATVARNRKTKTQRDEESADADRRAWELFRPKLDALQTFAEAQLLAAETPPPDSLGRRYYSNLVFFLQAFIIPTGSNYAEKTLYLQFIQRLDAAGALKQGAGQRVVEELRRAIEERGP